MNFAKYSEDHLEATLPVPQPALKLSPRPEVRGKSIFVGSEKFFIRGVTYGTFGPNSAGENYPEPEVVAADFAQMVANGINSIRSYTVPPVWLLDLAHQQGLKVMVGLPWEQHIAFLDSPLQMQDIREQLRRAVQSCGAHPAILAYALGNEIPAPMVRWYGRRRVERFLKRLYEVVKQEDPQGLVTYVNYPSTEYLQLPFLDFVAFNVYLEAQEKLEAYLARLHNLTRDRPLLMAEIGLDSLRNGEAQQAETLQWQIRSVFDGGCVGCFLFAWTDEWHRGGQAIEDWNFGLVERSRQAKPALETVRQAFAQTPFPSNIWWPRISVAVCSHNGSRTIRDTLEGLSKLDYPDFEVIVVDDGSTDEVTKIAATYDVRLFVHPQNHGLSQARNTALEAATGEIIAYIDDDAYPDPHWLRFLALTFSSGNWAAVGGPNIPPPDDGLVADCVANAPGGPTHLLLSDREAEHIPGCNMAIRSECLRAIGGFDPTFRVAGDDVDMCWRLHERGWKIGFSPSAIVWHHHRNSVKTYWKQQRGYGKAEALLEQKWPDRYNSVGHLSWSGRLYGRGIAQLFEWRFYRIYHGTWGSAPFQSIYQPNPSWWSAMMTTPEWYLVVLLFGGFWLLGLNWSPMRMNLPLLALAIAFPLALALVSASHASFTYPNPAPFTRLKLLGLTSLLYLMQPLARLWGRMSNGLTPWRRRGLLLTAFPVPHRLAIWSEGWRSSESWLLGLEQRLRAQGKAVRRGGDFDSWDLEVRGGLLGSSRMLLTIEEHGGGKQLVRLRSWPRIPIGLTLLVAGLAWLALLAGMDRAFVATVVLGTGALLFGLGIAQDSAIATASVLKAVDEVAEEPGCKRLVQGGTNRPLAGPCQETSRR